MNPAIANAIRDLEAQRDQLTAAINTLRGLAPAPAAATPASERKQRAPKREPRAPKAPASTKAAPATAPDRDAVLAALRSGPKSRPELEKRLKTTTYFLKQVLAQLMGEGVVMAEGATTNRRFFLATVSQPAPPAKEAPSRLR